MRVALQKRSEIRCVVVSSKAVEMLPPLQGLCWQLNSPETFWSRRQLILDAAGSDFRGHYALAIFIAQAGKHLAVAVGDLRFAEKPRNVWHGLIVRCQSFKLASMRGMHNGDAKPSCHVNRGLSEVVAKTRLVIRKIRRHGKRQVPPARSADDEIHFACQPAHRLGTDHLPAQGHTHGTSWSRKNSVIRTADVVAVLPHGRQVLNVAG